MFVVHVQVRVKTEAIETFIAATRKNAAASLREPGVARFDVIQDSAEPSRFVLVEVYRDDQAPARHKETVHYAEWRDAVADLMAEPRSSTKYRALYPEPARWNTPHDELELADTLPGRSPGQP